MRTVPENIDVFTDGSCHTRKLVGAWVALMMLRGEQKILQGIAHPTTHHRMELTAVLEALEFLKDQAPVAGIRIITDSQYVTGLPGREAGLRAKQFSTKAGRKIANEDLLIRFYDLLATMNVSLLKVKAHQQNADVPDGNHEADHLSRALVREAVKDLI